MTLVRLGGAFCRRFDCAYHDIERAFDTALGAKKYACRVCLILELFSAKCASAVFAYVKM